MNQKAYILHLETSSPVCSVALSLDGKLLSIKESEEGYEHVSKLTVYIQDCLNQNDLSISDLNAVAVSAGPGSYTGLRVAYSVAKGICFSLSIPMLEVSTLLALARACKKKHADFNQYVPMIDARRNEVYTEIYSKSLEVEKEIHALVLEDSSFSQFESHVAYVGNGAFKMQNLLKEGDEIFSEKCSARLIIEIAHQKFVDEDFVDVAYSNPTYLKPPNITKPKSIL